MAGWVSTGWVEPGWVETESGAVGEVDVLTGLTVLTLAAPGEALGATAFGDPGAIALIHHRNPGPYSDTPIFGLRTWSGQRLYGQVVPPEDVIGSTDDIGRFDSLISVSSINFTSVPLGNDLIGSMSATERPEVINTLDNRDKSWSKLVVTEPLLSMPAANWLHYGGGDAHLVVQGQVSRIVLTQFTTVITTSEP